SQFFLICNVHVHLRAQRHFGSGTLNFLVVIRRAALQFFSILVLSQHLKKTYQGFAQKGLVRANLSKNGLGAEINCPQQLVTSPPKVKCYELFLRLKSSARLCDLLLQTTLESPSLLNSSRNVLKRAELYTL